MCASSLNPLCRLFDFGSCLRLSTSLSSFNSIMCNLLGLTTGVFDTGVHIAAQAFLGLAQPDRYGLVQPLLSLAQPHGLLFHKFLFLRMETRLQCLFGIRSCCLHCTFHLFLLLKFDGTNTILSLDGCLTDAIKLLLSLNQGTLSLPERQCPSAPQLTARPDRT